MRKGLLELNKKLDFLMMDVANSDKLSADERVVSGFVHRKNAAADRVKALRREADETILPVVRFYTDMDDCKRQIAEHNEKTAREHAEMHVLSDIMGEISRKKIALKADTSSDNTGEIDRLSAEYDAQYAKYKPLSNIVFPRAIEDTRQKLRQSEEVLQKRITPPREEIEARNGEIQREIAELTRKLDAMKTPRIEQLFDQQRLAFNAIATRHAELPFGGSNDNDSVIIERRNAYRAITAELVAAIGGGRRD